MQGLFLQRIPHMLRAVKDKANRTPLPSAFNTRRMVCVKDFNEGVPHSRLANLGGTTFIRPIGFVLWDFLVCKQI